MVIVFLSSFNNTINISNEEYVVESANTVIKLYEYGMDVENIMDAASNNRVEVLIYDEYEDIPNVYRRRVYQYHRARLDEERAVIIRANTMFAICKLDDYYCIVNPLYHDGPITIRIAIVVAAFITVSVAAFIVFLGVGTFMKPLLNMSVAARKVAEGDYDVKLEPRENKDALGQLIEDFNDMCKKLSQTEMLRNDFVSGISHEFKTPIQSIYGFANILKEETTNDTHKEYLARICDEAERLSNLSASILQLNRLDNMVDIGNRDYYYLDEQIRQTILMLERKWVDKNINLNIELNKVKIYARGDLMKQVFINLIDNAIKYTPVNGNIDIELIKKQDHCIAIIRDSGKGIIDSEKELIFEKFYKSDHSRNTTGNGLGLAIVKRILTMHGYSIKVHNVINGGAEFIIEMPFKPLNQ